MNREDFRQGVTRYVAVAELISLGSSRFKLHVIGGGEKVAVDLISDLPRHTLKSGCVS